MAELRALFIIQNKNILFSQRFPSVEKKVRLLSGECYCALPCDYQMVPVLNELIREAEQKNHLEERSHCTPSLLENRQQENEQRLEQLNASYQAETDVQLKLQKKIQMEQYQDQGRTLFSQEEYKQKSKRESSGHGRKRTDWFEQVVELLEMNALVQLVVEEGRSVMLFPQGRSVVLFPQGRSVVLFPFLKEYHLSMGKSTLAQLMAEHQSLDICDRLGRRLLVFLREQPCVDALNLQNILNHVAPFGRVLDDELEIIQLMVYQLKNYQKHRAQNQEYTLMGFNDKLSQFQYLYYTNRQAYITLNIQETLTYYSFSRIDMKNSLRISGIISGRFQINPNVEVTLQVHSNTPPLLHSLQLNTQGKISQQLGVTTKQLVFTPHLDHYQIASYHLTTPSSLPLQGVYQKKQIDSNQLLIFLSLYGSPEHSLDQLKALLTVRPDHSIASTDIIVQQGSVTVLPEKDTLEWNIGPLQHNEVSLSGTIYLAPHPKQPLEVDSPEYVQREDYVQIHFIKNDSLFSDVQLLSNHISLYPNVPVKTLKIQRRSSTHKFIIYNNLIKDFTPLTLS